MSNEIISSDIGIASNYIDPITSAKDSALQTTVNSSTISFSNLSACERVKNVNGKSLTSTSQYGGALSRDLANFTLIATTFAEKDAQISNGG
ncbi:TIGR04197 family type VII secretion effector [Enterococcus sp. BWM-S5]|uniref:TIGR04197 family type VII secretion effector n=1 Tax=Enterococcus larvae TaxID=2794352 RepID=A0ABS4CHQ3_9ENTE|nr:TIGR04197 family type VII secretion effector [Enterococcus larvae]MBP1046156.1 TIGR04197 family type VII secretion effector [Enterococcus larvae]